MKTLTEYNADRIEEQKRKEEEARKPRLAGVSCPKCEAEMEYTDGHMLLSNPPKMRVRCSKCGHKDYMIV